MIITCDNYARTHCIKFTLSKSKSMCFNTDSCHNVRIYLNNMPIVNTKPDIHLGNFISCDIYYMHIDNTVCYFYHRSHGLINEFRACDCITLDNLHRTYCMHMYDCELRNLNDKRIAWRKIKRRIWKLPASAHNIIVHNLSSNFYVCLDMRNIKFVYNALNHSNEIVHNLLHTKLNCMRSTFSENYQCLSFKY